MGRSSTLQQQQLLLPSLGGCPGRHSRQRPPLRSLRLAREDPTHTTIGQGARICSALLPARPPPPTLAASGQRGIWAEEALAAAAAAARKRRPGGCCYPTPPTRSGCNALGPASARLLPACAGLVRAAVCRRGSSPSPRCPPPPPVPCPPPSQSRAPAAAASGAGDARLDSPRCRSGRQPQDPGRSNPCAKRLAADAGFGEIGRRGL